MKKKIKSTKKQLALCTDIGIPNKDRILNYCIDRGVKNPRFYLEFDGIKLYGEDVNYRAYSNSKKLDIEDPLIWRVCKEIGIFGDISRSGFDYCSVVPIKFKLPKNPDIKENISKLKKAIKSNNKKKISELFDALGNFVIFVDLHYWMLVMVQWIWARI
jgi:hypothetical protein